MNKTDKFDQSIYQGIGGHCSYVYDGGCYGFESQKLCILYDEFSTYELHQCQRHIGAMMHFVSFTGWVNNVKSGALNADGGLLHELIHIMQFSQMKDRDRDYEELWHELREDFIQLCKPFYYQDWVNLPEASKKLSREHHLENFYNEENYRLEQHDL